MVYIFGQGGSSDNAALRLDTRRKRHIDNEMHLEKPRQGMLDVAAEIESAHPGTQLVSASAVYNCFGLAFGSRRTSITDGEQVRKALDDDGFRRLAWDYLLWDVGDIVLYRTDREEISHVAVVLAMTPRLTGEMDVRVISAWGESGEYVHWMNPNNALLGEPYAVYSQRIR